MLRGSGCRVMSGIRLAAVMKGFVACWGCGVNFGFLSVIVQTLCRCLFKWEWCFCLNFFYNLQLPPKLDAGLEGICRQKKNCGSAPFTASNVPPLPVPFPVSLAWALNCVNPVSKHVWVCQSCATLHHVSVNNLTQPVMTQFEGNKCWSCGFASSSSMLSGDSRMLPGWEGGCEKSRAAARSSVVLKMSCSCVTAQTEALFISSSTAGLLVCTCMLSNTVQRPLDPVMCTAGCCHCYGNTKQIHWLDTWAW